MNPEEASNQAYFLDNRWQVNNSFCKKQKEINLECYFHPWTVCTKDEIMNGNTISKLVNNNHQHNNAVDKTYISDTTLVKEKLHNLTSKTVVMESRGDVKIIPHIFEKLLNCSPVHIDAYNYWWKNVAIAFFLRPNRATLKIFENFRNNATAVVQHYFDSNNNNNNNNNNLNTQNKEIENNTVVTELLLGSKKIQQSNNNNLLNILYKKQQIKEPLTISIYIRRGDKHVEMNLFETSIYLEHAQVMLETKNILFLNDENKFDLLGNTNNMNNNNNNNIKTLKNNPTIFVASEDPVAISETVAWCLKKHWNVKYTNLFNRNDVSANKNFTIQQKERQTLSHVHHELEYLNMLFNIDFHLKSNAFVCTLYSNFCRVIDELKNTVANKANYHFVDLSCILPQYNITNACFDVGGAAYDW
jgi:hypothetical protein